MNHLGGGVMIPGTTSKMSESTLASAASISPKTDIVLVTELHRLIPSFQHLAVFSGMVVLIPTNAAGVTFGTSGNILCSIAAAQNRGMVDVRASLGKWVINSGV
jgi:hypothetical protein